jgi:adenylate cyclase class 2
VFDPPLPIKGGWLRVRQEADGVTMSLKIVDGDKIENQKEIELEIDNYKQGVEFLLAIGARHKSYQETKRELWNFMNTQVTIDTWPGLQPFVEIEGDNEEVVTQAALALGFDYSKAYFGAVDVVYEAELGIPFKVINQMPIITFENPPQRQQ